MLNKLISFIFLIIFALNVHAQEEDWATKLVSAEFKAKKVIPSTPEAAALGKYGNVPVSLFTGTPNISIPLYQLSGNNISIPIQLNYNAGGFNPQEIATWTGLGWTLNAGGVVTRSVKGNPDNLSNYFVSPSPLVVPSETTDPYAYYDYYENLRKGYFEAQPDMYYYNFAGHSGKFLVNPDQSILKKQKNNYIITANVSTTTGSNIIIKDEQGVTYEFREFEISEMTPDDISTDVPIQTYTYPSTWYLTKIISADGFEEIAFTYYTTALDHYQFNNFFQTQSDVYEEAIPLSGSPSFSGPATKSSTPATVKTKRKYLQQITFKRAGQLISYIDFESSVDQRQDLNHSTTSGFPGERLMNSVKVYTKKVQTTFALTKQFNLNYGYFTNSSNVGWDNKRLRLENVQEIPVTAATPTPPPHSFEYNDNGQMPSLSSTSMDHWGYYNPEYGTSSLVPTTNITNGNINIVGTNRQPSIAGSSAYLINKIKYPTGGYTTFEYELNQAIEAGTSNVISVGGVRIKKITDYSFNTKKAQEKNYEYKLIDGTSSGRAMVPQYLGVSRYKSLGTPPGNSGWTNVCDQDLLSQKITYSVSANSIIGLGSVQGSHIGYSRVTEYLSDVSNSQPLGKTVFEYYAAAGSWNAHDDDIGNGDLLKKSVYNNGAKLIQETSNTYNYILQGSIGAVAPGINTEQDNKNSLVKMNTPGIGINYGWYMHSTCATNVIESRIYKTKFYNSGWTVSSKEKQLTEQLVKQYDQLLNSYLSITKKFTYGNTAHTLPTKIEQTTSNNEVVVTEKKYPLDYIIPTSGTLDDNTTGIKLQKDKNIISSEVENIQYRQNADGSNKRYIKGSITNYNPAIPYPARLHRLEVSSPLTTFTLSGTNSGVFSSNANYKQQGSFIYTSNGTLSEQSKFADVPSAYIWDYDYHYATAEIINAQTGQVAYTSFETDGTGEWTTIPYISSNRITTAAVTGKYSYNLTSGNSITKTNLPATRQYIISYWSTNGTVTVTPNTGMATLTTGVVHNGWTYYEHLLPVNVTSVTLTAAGKNIDELRLYPKDALMTTVAYDPGVGVISQCSPNNQVNYFEYDGLSRLVNIKDEDGNMVKNYKYSLGTNNTVLTPSAQSLYYSAVSQGNYAKSGCPTGTEPTIVTYIVPYGKYVSSISQADADAKGETDKTTNGQAYANANGQCLYWNTEQSQYFSKNNCLYEQGTSKCSNTGTPLEQSRILYTVPAHTYSSATDLTTANNMALADISANGQNYANNYCWCSCAQEGQKYINGTCETGNRYNSSTTDLGNGLWECTYYYQFSDGSVSGFYKETSSSPCPVY